MSEYTLASSPAEEPEQELTAMSFFEHLEELRRRIIHSLLAVAVAFGACWYFAEGIFGLMQQPIMDALRNNGLEQKLVVLSPTDAFNMYLKVGLVTGVFVASPFILFQVWLFVSPGLYKNEKRYVLPFMFSSVALFLSGGLFGYKVVFPSALDFLLAYGRQFEPMITIGAYTDLFLTIILGLGIVFELPILVFFLSIMGVITAGWMWRNFRYSFLAIFIASAIITPTSDIMNLCIFAAPMLALYILSMGIAWIFNPGGKKKPA
ncbi:MAG: twin-arginine translocase subunit TatC [Candidatus Korobacteraceae bacterium]